MRLRLKVLLTLVDYLVVSIRTISYSLQPIRLDKMMLFWIKTITVLRLQIHKRKWAHKISRFLRAVYAQLMSSSLKEIGKVFVSLE